MQKPRVFGLAVLLVGQAVLFAGGPSEPPPGVGGGEALRIFRRYSGVSRVRGRAVSTRVIRTQAAYSRFIGSIPKHEIGMGPMPASRDPLLKRPHVNFNRSMMLVVVNPQVTSYRSPAITGVVREAGRIVVRYRMPRRGNYPMQWPYGVGEYTAVVVPRDMADIRFVKVR